jgi:hypothetical protein
MRIIASPLRGVYACSRDLFFFSLSLRACCDANAKHQEGWFSGIGTEVLLWVAATSRLDEVNSSVAAALSVYSERPFLN